MGEAVEGRAVDDRPRRYTRLPDDERLLELLRDNRWVQEDVANLLGCSPSAVGRRVEKIRQSDPTLVPPRRTGAPRVPQTFRIFELEQIVAALAARVDELEARPAAGPTRVIEWKPNHRRHSEGGIPVNRQFRAFRRSVARQAG